MNPDLLRSKALSDKLKKFDSKIIEEHPVKKSMIKNLLRRFSKKKKVGSFYEEGDVRNKTRSKAIEEYLDKYPPYYQNHVNQE